MRPNWSWSSANADATSRQNQAKDHILGYTIGNDVTARDLQKTDGQWTRAKGFDTFCSFGPWIDTEFDIIRRGHHLPGQRTAPPDGVHPRHGLQRGKLVAYISSVMTLEPGDLIFTGTPAGVGTLQDGDVVEVDIDGLGVLSNPVMKE